MSNIILLGCSSKKKTHSAKAIDLYLGAMFKKSISWAIRKYGTGTKFLILSAKYGVLEPNMIVAPYDESLNSMTRGERKAWAVNCRETLSGMRPGAKFIVMAGKNYAEAVNGLDAEFPLRGMSIGVALSWLGR
jgi:cytoplasmic iron level regulating protein YaaA (DUF328/UPF0246 family)